MKGRRKNIRPDLTDFTRYNGKKMSDMERNALEKELQKDPFAGEAAEGFNLFEGEDISEDMKRLDVQLRNRTVKNRKISYYRIAASIAVLMVISSVYIVLDRTRTSDQIENVSITDTFNIPENEALRQNMPEQIGINAPLQPSVAKSEKKPETDVPVVAERSVKDKSIIALKESEINDAIVADKSKEESKELDNSIAAGQVVVPSSTEKNDSFLASNAERKAVARSVSIDREAMEMYQPPQPVTGKDSFNIYIQKNIRIPENHPTGQTSVVRLNLRINRDGVIENIKVIESPGREYSSEAIRLIKEGPAWNPAIKEGKAAEESAKLDIIFR